MLTHFQQVKESVSLVPNYIKLLLLIFYVSPVLSVFLGQAVRYNFSWPNYDSPSRILLCLPIFIVVYHFKINAVKSFNISIPVTLILASLLVMFGFYTKITNGRVSLCCIDLLTFGSLSLTFGVLCFSTSGVFSKFISRPTLVSCIALFSGLYLSIGSGSRTGWGALPVVIILWSLAAFRHKYRALLLSGLFTFAVSVIAYVEVPMVNSRINQALQDIKSYNWNGPNTETSLGERISFARIGFSLLAKRPLSGWGDHSFASTIKESREYDFASQATRDWVIHCGFHSEIMTNAVRSGIWGVFSSLMLFMVPSVIFMRAFLSQNGVIRKYGVYGLTYVLCIFITSLSTEVFNLKYTASFHALMLSALMGTTLACTVNRSKTCAFSS